MNAPTSRPDVHLSHRSNWLRAAVLGADDGILSTASLVLGVAASGAAESVDADSCVHACTLGDARLTDIPSDHVSVSVPPT